jgi:SAM-dependent methyltransferase
MTLEDQNILVCIKDRISIFFRRIFRHGLLGLVKLIPVNIRFLWQALKPAAIAARRRERALDRELGIETAGNVPAGAVSAESGVAAQNNTYQPVLREDFEEIMSCLPTDTSSFCFIDVGSGKGRALVLAARRNFAQVIGIELSHNLHRIAEKNLTRIEGSLCTSVRILNLDAREFLFPSVPSVIFLFNPFGEDIMRAVISNIERTHRNSDVPVFLLYLWPFQEEVINERGMWQEIDQGLHWKAFTFVRKQEAQ